MDPLLEELTAAGAPADDVELILRLRTGSGAPPGVRIVAQFGSIVTCRVRRDRVRDTHAHPSVVSVKAPRLLAAEVEPPVAGPGTVLHARPAGATGRGVAVGVVDWGLDVAHLNFRRADGSSRVLALWDQGARTDAPASPYGYGRVHTADAIDRALRTGDPYSALGYHPADSDPFGDGAHGTHVCDIAAGNGRAPGASPGMAPDADIVFVHLATTGTAGLSSLGDTCRILEALDFIAKVAGARPWVANLSVGRCGGPHNGLTLVEQGMDQLLLQAPGYAIVQSTGNYYESQGHATGQIPPGGERTLTWRTNGADVTPNELEVWYPGLDAMTVTLRAPDDAVVARVALGEHRDVVTAGRFCGRIYHRRHDPSNGDNHIDIFLLPSAPAGAWRVTLHGDDIVDGRFNAWLERDSACPSCQSVFDPADADRSSTTGTICNALRTIAVGAYDPRDPAGALGRFSSSGPTRDGRQKPDLVAPGVAITAARSALRQGGGSLLTVKSGTSMAAPHVAGTIACMFQAAARPLWIHETRRLLLGSARGANAPPPDAARIGSGYLDAVRAVAAAAESRARQGTIGMPAHAEEDVAMNEHGWESSPLTGAQHRAESLDAADGAAESLARGRDVATRALARAEEALHGASPSTAAGVLSAALEGAWPAAARTVASFETVSGAGPGHFDAVGLPGGPLVATPAAGDVFVRLPAGEAALSHGGFLLDGELVRDTDLTRRGWAAERAAPGWYALVVEGGPFPHCAHRRFARRMLDEHGAVPAGQAILRVRVGGSAYESMRAAAESIDTGETANVTTVTVRNRLLRWDRVNGCEVELSHPDLDRPLIATTGVHGTARLNLAGVRDGSYTLRVRPAESTSDPAGPALASTTPRPARIWRPLSAGVTVRGERITASADDRVAAAGAALTVQLQPVWIASPNEAARSPAAATTATHIVVHHTAGPRIGPALNTFLQANPPQGEPRRSAHYVIDTDGEIVKMVHEDRASWHTGVAHWGGRDDGNNFTIGIEVVHRDGAYPAAQYDALIGLLERIRAAYPSIAAANIVGHSDIATCPTPGGGTGCNAPPRRLGRKWSDPGLDFEWERLEARGLGMVVPAAATLDATAYGGFFTAVPGGRLRSGDRDAGHRYDGMARPTITAAVIGELQGDLRDIGYYCPASGVYDVPTARAVRTFQEHFFAGSRPRAPHPGQVDATTAARIKALLPAVAAGAAVGGVTGATDAGEAVAAPAPQRAPQEIPAAPGPPRAVRARILWPALGFPAVIAPARDAGRGDDATRCICVLLLADRERLSRHDVAHHLRCVPWSARGRRHIPTSGERRTEAFLADDLLEPRRIETGTADKHGTRVAFGGRDDGTGAITAHLANRVLEFYRDQQLRFLHEIRVGPEASARLQAGTYHLFWNNAVAGEHRPSDEMALLLERFARPRREALHHIRSGVRDAAAWKKVLGYLLQEYEYEYGAMHPPYATQQSRRNPPRTEVLHPLFVRSGDPAPLRIGHITDTHVDVRADVYQENLRVFRHPKWTPASYNNWNDSFVRCYDHARRDAGILLLTGDLIDYGRGHHGPEARQLLGSDQHYLEDRNWFLFQYLIARRLAAGEAYTVPVYTILGNHDWRLNPYPPFAVAGAPSPELLIHNYWEFTEKERKAILEIAHGPGHERKFSYHLKAAGYWDLIWEQPRDTAKAAWDLANQTRTMDTKHLPTETTVESVAWYLLTINPFLDYAFRLPGGYDVLMLDWAEDEDVLFPIVVRGQEWPYMIWQAGGASGPGPKAKNCLTAMQKSLVEMFAAAPGAAKVIGIHAPPIGPYADWYDAELLLGFKVNERYDASGRKLSGNAAGARGPTVHAVEDPDGGSRRGHPLHALKPAKGPAGMVADYGSFESWRDGFIERLADPRAGVRLVFSGHIHRNGLFVAYVSGTDTILRGKAVDGQLLVRGMTESAVRGVRPPAVSTTPEGRRAPLYVNTTSAGPRGHLYQGKDRSWQIDPGYAHVALAADGTIRDVIFRAMGITAPTTTKAVAPAMAGVPVG